MTLEKTNSFDLNKTKDFLEKEIYGCLPKRPEHLSFRILSEDISYAAGKARRLFIELTLHTEEMKFSFPVSAVIPNGLHGKIPAFISISHTDLIPNEFLPAEEISDNGFAIFSFCYNDAVTDSGRFSERLPAFLTLRRRKSDSPGKLMLWAYAAMRVMDYVMTLEFIDKERIAVIGHGMLAHSALLAAAFDGRFSHAVANALSALSNSSNISKPYLFAPKYYKGHKEAAESIRLLTSPRKIILGEAEDGSFSESGFLPSDTEIEANNSPALFYKKNVCFYKRLGTSYLSRSDWQVYMNYVKDKNNDLQ